MKIQDLPLVNFATGKNTRLIPPCDFWEENTLTHCANWGLKSTNLPLVIFWKKIQHLPIVNFWEKTSRLIVKLELQ